MLVDADGRFQTQRRHPRMARIKTALTGNGFVVTAPGREPLSLPFALEGADYERCSVRVWTSELEATLADSDTNIWFSEYMGFACGLVYLGDDQHRAVPNPAAEFDDEVSFADGAPVLLITDASLAGLNERLAQPVPIDRFRPNIVVSVAEPHAEDGWRQLSIGDAKLDVAWPCSRCIMPSIDQETGEKAADGEPLTTLNAYRRRDGQVYFGQNLIPRRLGTIRTGAICAIDEIIGR